MTNRGKPKIGKDLAVKKRGEIKSAEKSKSRVAAKATDLTKLYGNGDATVKALAGVSVELARGEFTAIMGPSGSGKSTLMHCLAGLDTPTSGLVSIAGSELTTLSDNELTRLRRDRIGFIFQSFNLVPTLTARENITLPRDIAGQPIDDEWFTTVVERLGLSKRLGHRPSELSGGQQQRVACARALVGQPEIIFGDEPTGNLDSRSSAEVLDILRKAVDELDQTVVIVTHDPRAASFADRVIFLADGLVVDELREPDADAVYEYMKHLDDGTTTRALPAVKEKPVLPAPEVVISPEIVIDNPVAKPVPTAPPTTAQSSTDKARANAVRAQIEKALAVQERSAIVQADKERKAAARMAASEFLTAERQAAVRAESERKAEEDLQSTLREAERVAQLREVEMIAQINAATERSSAAKYLDAEKDSLVEADYSQPDLVIDEDTDGYYDDDGQYFEYLEEGDDGYFHTHDGSRYLEEGCYLGVDGQYYQKSEVDAYEEYQFSLGRYPEVES